MRRFKSKSLIFFLIFSFATRLISDVSDESIKWSELSLQWPLSQILKMMRTLIKFRVDWGDVVELVISSFICCVEAISWFDISFNSRFSFSRSPLLLLLKIRRILSFEWVRSLPKSSWVPRFPTSLILTWFERSYSSYLSRFTCSRLSRSAYFYTSRSTCSCLSRSACSCASRSTYSCLSRSYYSCHSCSNLS